MNSFERRCVTGDMIEVFKMLSGLNDLNVDDFLNLNFDDRIRGHHMKIKKLKCRLDLRKHFFSFRVVEKWSNLPT